MKTVRSISFLFLVAIVAFALFGCSKNESDQANAEIAQVQGQAREIQNKQVIAERDYPEAPAFTLQDLDGNDVSLSDFKGKMVVLNFWATWCGPCRMEIPSFVKLQDEYRDRGLAFIGISVDMGAVDTVQEFADEFDINYPILMHSMEVTYAYGINPIPTTFIINRDGKVVNVLVGYRPEEVFRREIEKWLPGSVAVL